MTTTISSRTPEGNSGHCAICGHQFEIDPSWPGGDAPCPSCGHLVWVDCPASPTPVTDKEACLLRLGTQRFGRLPVKLREAFWNAVEREGAETIVLRMLEASTWQDLLRTG